MKLFREVFIIFGISYLGDCLQKIMDLPLPGSLIGMIILLCCLQVRLIKLHQIETVSDFLLGHLPFFFIPAGVSLLSYLGMIQNIWISLIVICILTTIITMGVSGKVVEWCMNRKENVHE